MSETLPTAAIPQAPANPLLKPWQTPFETPPFADIAPDHFLPAFERAFADHSAEIAAITHDPSTPDFANTVTALERSGKLLSKVSAVFYDLVSAHSNPALLEIDKEVSLRMARHWNPIMMNAVLFGRIALLHDNRATLGLTGEQMRLLERTYTRFHRAGAGLDEAAQKRMAEINERLAHLGTAFGHHLLGDEQDWFLELGEADRDGLSDSFVAAAQAAATDRGMAGKAIMTLSRSFVEPFLKTSTRRDLREKVFKASSPAATTTTPTTTTLPSSRFSACARRAPGSWAFRPSPPIASRIRWPRRPRQCAACWSGSGSRRGPAPWPTATPCRHWSRREGGNFALAPWDWRYYAEKLRQVRANFDDAAIKPYLALDHMIEAAFDCATRLFGVTFSERKDIPVWHPDVRVWEVKDSAGRHQALFYGDYFARPSKRSGAWMTSLRDQQKLDGDVAPLVINVCNFSKGADGEPSLLSPDDARTLFHEFGHALHGMLSDVTYPSLSGTSVFTDFVELPSQLYEHWQEQPQVLRRFARHYQTGEPLPDDLLKRFIAARKFNQGFATVEFVSSALIDLEFHTQPAAASRDVRAFEKAELEKIGMPAEISMRHRPQQFGHIFSGDHYAAGYYSYMWSEVMDADAFGAFEEAGNIFDPAVAKRLHDDIYSSGGSRDPEDAYVAFRGRGARARRAVAPPRPAGNAGSGLKVWLKMQQMGLGNSEARHARPCAGHPRLGCGQKKDVDGRDKPGHDEKGTDNAGGIFSHALT